MIVTSNLKDFPDRALARFEIEAKSPDQFLMILLRRDSETMMRIVREQAAGLRKPPMTVQEVLDDIAPITVCRCGPIGPWGTGVAIWGRAPKYPIAKLNSPR